MKKTINFLMILEIWLNDKDNSIETREKTLNFLSELREEFQDNKQVKSAIDLTLQKYQNQ